MSRSSPESVTVPIEPTREMWAAMANAVIGKTSVHHDVVVEAVYRAMVTSAPAAGHAQTPAESAFMDKLDQFARTIAPYGYVGGNAAITQFLAKAREHIAESPDTSTVRTCDHDWKIWPETDGHSQRCMKCGAYRDTPTSSPERK